MCDAIWIGGDRMRISNESLTLYNEDGSILAEFDQNGSRIKMNNVEYRQVIHAKWEQSNVSSRQVRCSHCKGSVHFWHGKREWDWKFCKDCGAVMDLEV